MIPSYPGYDLYAAAKRGDLAGVRSLLPSATTHAKGLALHSAVTHCHEDIVACLLAAGCWQTDKDEALGAAANIDSAGIAQLLLDAGADVHSFANEALRTAARRGGLDMARLLLKAGADVHASDDQALLWAAHCGHTALVHCLLDAGADIHAVDDSALWEAVRRGHLDTVRHLLQAGADIHAHGAAALSAAAETGHVAVAHYLLTAGKYRQAELGKALRKAAERRFPEIVILLRLHGASLSHLAPKLDQYPDEVQLAAVSTGSLARIRVERYAKLLCLDALHVLLERTGHADLSAMLKATQLLEPLTPDERAALLRDLLAKTTTPETDYAKS